MNQVFQLGSEKPIYELTNEPGLNSFIENTQGGRFPLGASFAMPNGGFTDIVNESTTNALIAQAANMIDAEHQSVFGISPNYKQIMESSPGGGAWDFKWQRDYLDPASLYLMDGTAQQYDVAGNAMWAAGMKQIGVPELMAKGAAEGYAIYDSLTKGTIRLDDPRDQLGIDYGYNPSWEGSAGGGFVLYPNKANLNMMKAVYRK